MIALLLAACVTTTGSNAALTYLDGEAPAAAKVRPIEPESSVCDPATALEIADVADDATLGAVTLTAELLSERLLRAVDATEADTVRRALEGEIVRLRATVEAREPFPWGVLGAGAAIGAVAVVVLAVAVR